MPKQTKADQAIHDAADEIRRETRAAAAEVRIELGAARRETAAVLREAMTELRLTLSEIWEPEGSAKRSPSSPSGGRMSRAQRKELTRELLLDAAIGVFAEKGYHGASLDDVADAAGFTKGAVYSNFTRKSDLFRALLERETERYDQALTRTVEAVPPELLPDVAAELLADPGVRPGDADAAGRVLAGGCARPGPASIAPAYERPRGRSVRGETARRWSRTRVQPAWPARRCLRRARDRTPDEPRARIPRVSSRSCWRRALRKLLATDPPGAEQRLNAYTPGP